MPTPTPAPTGTFGAIDHVVVVIQENRTVDNLFNGYPGADTVTRGKSGNTYVALKEVPLEPNAGADHSYAGFVADYNGGRMNGFARNAKGKLQGAYEYVRHSDVANYWSLAQRFTLADEVFQMNMGPSFAAHVNLVAAQGGYPMAVAGNPHGHGALPGCLGTEQVIYVDMRMPYPSPQSYGPACTEVQTIFDLLDAKHVSWRYYAPSGGFGLQYWSAPDYVQHIALGPDRQNLVNPETRILDDIRNDKLPSVSYVVPRSCTSDHPHGGKSDPLAGPKWVTAITNAIGTSSYWSHTLILVTWDDWGGFYDHVPPRVVGADQLGFRVPLLAISAYPATPGAVDHRARTQASVLSAIESVFGLPSLGQLDAQSDNLAADFRFDRAPIRYGAPLPSSTAAPPSGNCPITGASPDDN